MCVNKKNSAVQCTHCKHNVVTIKSDHLTNLDLSLLIVCVCIPVENSAHCDFIKLRNMLVRTHMQDLKDVTRETHYENYRAQCIQSMTRMVVKERNRKYEEHTRSSHTHLSI